MPRFDKYEPHVGGFRAAAGEQTIVFPDGTAPGVVAEGKLLPVALRADGTVRVVIGDLGADEKPVGVTVITRSKVNPGHIVDVMTSGEVEDTGLDPGVTYGLDASGNIVPEDDADGSFRIGFVLRTITTAFTADCRLVVRTHNPLAG